MTLRISESYVDPNPLMVEIQDPDNFTRFQTRERCALEIAAYVFKSEISRLIELRYNKNKTKKKQDEKINFHTYTRKHTHTHVHTHTTIVTSL